ncbi:dihydropteroate synthase [Parendozoicomonas haliclonae]|uniref:Dihydropteroate synthase n=1 Tax=Parendozoicomonas haliclonae TaxID=1960125 RepID=A0A1X7ADE9_9GAMM|nr:dihydropteroate synthase [Parendozoicomonas haliclonae]SMA31612.1 Dihydropteroate synthase [Parendozoicomonas haliclonae]
MQRPSDLLKLCAGRELDLSVPQIMGILNVTPDSFSDGGRYNTLERALIHAREMIAAGARIVDIGGESTRPNAHKVTTQEEIDRVVPVIEALRRESDVIISIDTSSPDVMREAVAAGAGIINDVRALSLPGALDAAVMLQVPVILMHSLVEQPAQGVEPEYADVVLSVGEYLLERVVACESAGVRRENIILDPGFGAGMFGKTPPQNFELIRRFAELHELGFPLLAGVSRKSFIGSVLSNTEGQRLSASLALAVLLAQSGAQILRVHDVQETADALAMLKAVATV